MMKKAKASAYSQYLSELQDWESRLEKEDCREEFLAWKKKVGNDLDGSHKIRFLKLKFFYEMPECDDEIPF